MTRPKIFKHSSSLTVKLKVKVTLEQPMKAQRGIRGISLFL
jgi:hypothetical protein